MNVPLALPEPTTARWQLLRAGIQNIWEYDDQRFVFHRGRLLLRGQNESGKTKALEVLLPFLLDASLQPHRLDPFGSTARPMRWNLLNDSNPDVSVAIGYVWLELGRVDGDGVRRFCTVGAGLKAKRSTLGVEDWYFVTSRRVDVDLRLYDENRVPLTRAALGEALGEPGQPFDRGADYRVALNARLFGMPMEQYSALVDALLQLRRPQLSKQLDPVELSGILSASLPPLDAAVVGTLAEGFERLDRHRLERDELAGTLSGLRAFLGTYRGYVASFVKARALELTRAESAYHAARAALRQLEERRETAERRQRELAEAIVRLEQEGDALEERIRTLRGSDEYRAVQALDEAEKGARRARERASQARDAVTSSRELVAVLERKVRAQEEAVSAGDEEARRAEALARSRATEALLEPVHLALHAALGRGELEAARGTLATALQHRDEALASLSAHVRRTLDAVAQVEKASDRLVAAHERMRGAEAKLADGESKAAQARERFFDEVGLWAEGLRVLSVDVDALVELPPGQMRRHVEDAAAPVRQRVEREVSAATFALSQVERELERTRRERDALAANEHQPPLAPPWRAARSPDRPGAPLYLLCEFVAGVDASAQAGLEAALEAAGLLDAWVTPAGQLLDPSNFDVVLVPEPLGGATLAEVLAPAKGAPVPEETIAAVLRSIGLARGGAEPAEMCWVSGDGRFRVGPLHGANGKEAAALIGTAAREQARLRRLAELDARLAELDSEYARGQERLRALEGERETLGAELHRFPAHAGLLEREAAVTACAEALAEARGFRDEAAARLAEKEAALREAAAERDANAAKLGLRGWVERLDDLRARTMAYERAARELISATVTVEGARQLLREQGQRYEGAQASHAQAERTAQQSDGESARAEAHLAALQQTIGSTRDEVLGAIRSSEERRSAAREELKSGRAEKERVDQQFGALVTELAAAQDEVGKHDQHRRDAETRLREAAGRGLLPLAGVEESVEVATWSYTDALRTARRVDEATPKVDPSDAARDRAWNKVSEKHQELMRSLRPEIRVTAEQVSGLMLYRATFNARGMSLLELGAELEAEVASRERLLGEEEQKLFESFLTGEAHEHLRERLREAFA
ncbi:MAG TPA: TIGR02680 family protein, partial [Myxococcaceae bacterium]|nr:TIGR02680 family protein [Myxococcaceae bacterium]